MITLTPSQREMLDALSKLYGGVSDTLLFRLAIMELYDKERRRM